MKYGNHQNEAINCGLPILYLNSGCMKDIVKDMGLNIAKKIYLKR